MECTPFRHQQGIVDVLGMNDWKHRVGNDEGVGGRGACGAKAVNVPECAFSITVEYQVLLEVAPLLQFQSASTIQCKSATGERCLGVDVADQPISSKVCRIFERIQYDFSRSRKDHRSSSLAGLRFGD